MAQMKVLLSDDRKDYFTKCAAIFAAYECETISAPKDGEKVCEMIREKRPDIVLMEVFMPHKDAVAVMKEIKADVTLKTPLFYTISSFDSSTLERELTAAGAAYFFLRPIETDLLIERVLEITENRRKAQSVVPVAKLEKAQTDLHIMVTDVIHQIGVPAHIKGYHYLRDSIVLAVDQPDIINSVTKELYPTVAKNCSTTPSRVERAIRHAIEVAWDRGDVDILTSYFGYTIHNGRGKPTNSEFIAMISDKIRLKLRAMATA